jgi:hypothetical membrane protein
MGRAMTPGRLADLAPRAGLIGAAAIAACSVLAGVAFRGIDGELYSPLNHYVSELGRVGVSSLAAVFNAGLIVGGACFAAFMAGLGREQGAIGGATFGILGVIAGLAGLLIGIFPMGTPTLHVLFALLFFNVAWIAIALASVDLLVRPNPRLPGRLGWLGLAVVAAFIGFIWSYTLLVPAGSGLEPSAVRPAFDPVTTFEWLAILGVVAWTGAVSLAWERSRHAAAA